MTEIDVAGCDFYNEKICALFSKYFGFNVECENVFLSTIDCDIERECPIKRLETENAKLKEALEEIKKISKIAFAVCDDDCGNANKFMDIINKVSEVLEDE